MRMDRASGIHRAHHTFASQSRTAIQTIALLQFRLNIDVYNKL